MAPQAEPRPARHRASVQNAPDARTFRTSETLGARVAPAAPTAALDADFERQARQVRLFHLLQARYG